jgi:hypothetical protein
MRASSAHSDRKSDRRAQRARLGWTTLISRSDVSDGTTMAPTRASIAASAVALLLTACGHYGPGKLQPGQTEAEARAALGEPTLRSTLPGGATRLDYGRGPYGKQSWRVELDAAGKVTGISQLLNDSNFQSLRPGWSKDQVLDRVGPPSETRVGWRGLGEVWSYRFDDWFTPCRWFQVWLVEGRVREAGYSTDPVCQEPVQRG